MVDHYDDDQFYPHFHMHHDVWNLDASYGVPVVSVVGSGPKGEKGDPGADGRDGRDAAEISFNDLTEEQRQEIYSNIAQGSNIVIRRDQVEGLDDELSEKVKTYITNYSYVLTDDEEVHDGKDYYIIVESADDSVLYQRVENPVDEKLSTYYEIVSEFPEPPYYKGDIWVRDGNRLYVCTSDNDDEFDIANWREVTAISYDGGEAYEQIIAAQIQAAINKENERIRELIEEANILVENHIAIVQSVTDVLKGYIDLDTSGTLPVLRIGSENSNIRTEHTPNALNFLRKGQNEPVASIAADEDGVSKLFARTAKVDQMQTGDWVIFERKNGNLCIKYNG